MSDRPNFAQARGYLEAMAGPIPDGAHGWVRVESLAVVALRDFPHTPEHVLRAALLTEYRAMSDYGIATVAGTLIRLDITPEGTPAP